MGAFRTADLRRRAGGLRGLARTSRSGSRRSSRCSIPRTLELTERVRAAWRRRPARTTCWRDSVAGELISSEIEIRSGKRRGLRRRDRPPARAPARACSRSRPTRAGARRDRRCIRGAPGRSSASSTRRTTGASRRGSSTWRGATTPSATTSTSGCAAPTARSRSATPCARCCPTLLAASANSAWVEGCFSGLHSARTQIFTQSFPRCGVPDHLRRLATHTPTTSTSCSATQLDRRAHADLVERPAAPRRSARSSCGSWTPSPAATSRRRCWRWRRPASRRRRSTTTPGCGPSRSPRA